MNRREFVMMGGGCVAASPSFAAPARKPNIVLIFCDDLGYGDLGCYGSNLSTPRIDKLAGEGTRFTSCISANPVCSPSRAALLTGRYPTRCGVPSVLFPYDKEGLNRDEKTLADLLKAHGYRTKCVGKWHLGHMPDYLPTARGFDEYFGIPYSNDMKPAVLMRNTDTVSPEADQSQITAQYTKEAVDFINRGGDQPFFLYLPHTFPHIPLFVSERFAGKSSSGLYGDVLAELDWSTGEVIDALKKKGVERDTIVIFTSDNGPWHQGSSGPLRNRKGSTFEGGVRVPLIVRWAGQVPAGKTSKSLVSAMDYTPTVLALAGAPKPEKAFDGVNIAPILRGQGSEAEREPLLYFDGWNLQAARMGKWKLHVARYNSEAFQTPPPGGRINYPIIPELYDLERDPAESYEVAKGNPALVASIKASVEKQLTSFPEEVQKAWTETQSRTSTYHTPGQRPQTIVKPAAALQR